MKKYSINLKFNQIEKIETFDIGQIIKFNIQDGLKSYSTKIVDVEIENKNELNIVCLLDDEHYKDFHSCDYTKDWCDFDLEKCIINNENLIDEYLC